MLRHFTRNIQQRFKRSNCFEKPDTCVNKDIENKAQYKCKVLKSLIQPCTCTHFNRFIVNYYNDKNNKEKYYKDTSDNINYHTFFEAFGWSGALVFGWVVSKHIWLKQKFSNQYGENKKTLQELGVIQLLTQIVTTQPPVTHVLPQLKSPLIVSSKLIKEGGNEIINEDKELEKAAHELLIIHEKAVGEALNRKGIACLSKSSGSEAMKYFIRASELKYPPASFNMGQCYELGIGTKQDFKQAAEWYTIASEQGHATAMYNLGVFHAHGWGGLKADIECAKKFFLKAATQGQPDAIAALDKESKFNCDLHCSTNKFSKSIDSTNLSHKTSPNIFVNNFKNELANDVMYQKGLKADCNWNISLNSTIAF